MPSRDYDTIRVYLHKERDKKLLEHLKTLPRYLRQSFMRESLQGGVDQQVGEPMTTRPAVPQGFKKYSGAEG